MDPALAPHYERLRGRMSEAEFLTRLQERDREFGGLLDPQALALLVLDEEGLDVRAAAPPTAHHRVAGLAPGTYGNDLLLRLVRVGAPRTFSRPDGSTGTLLECEAEDAGCADGARVPLVAWDEAAAVVAGLPPGTVLEALDVATKERRGRLEAHTTRRTRLRAGAGNP